MIPPEQRVKAGLQALDQVFETIKKPLLFSETAMNRNSAGAPATD